MLAYLIADGNLTSGTLTDFVSKDSAMLDEYVRCLQAFPDVKPTYTAQIRGVTRVGAAKAHDSNAHYHTPNSLLAWLRELGLKASAGTNPGGATSRDKFVPEFVFELNKDEITFFVASLWDGDGYMGRKLCHYKTISRRLADDVQTLLLRIGISSTIHTARYWVAGHDTSSSQARQSYQVTVYDTKRFASKIQPYLVSPKRLVVCTGQAAPDISRARFLEEVDIVWTDSYRSLMQAHGIDRQHFYSHKRNRSRIPTRVAAALAESLSLPQTERHVNVIWDEIVAIEPAGLEHVYDLTVEGLHSFVANNIIVHNCVYQEQVIRLLTDIAGYTAAEADNVRRAISKKSEKTLIQHREIFAKGAAERSRLKRSDSDSIWDALMGFARYGFNRAHGADYAVITVQTAYLKAHYPLEYMAALLHVERDNTEKVAYYITESRRMGIEVLSPDVNASKLDFTVEQLPADAPPPAGRDSRIGYSFPVPQAAAIRYGLVAVKNVGEGPVEAIAAARAQGDAFRTLDDLCERVNLRKVGKKALECLIKVGALDAFGERAQLLEAMDQMIGASKSRHEAEEVGQLSMFDLLGGADLGGAQAGFASSLKLPTVDPLTPKQRLEMEKELLGVYVSSHPLQQMVVDLTGVITCTCGELNDNHVGKGVVLAGNIVRVNQITTKKGDRMAFVTLEDLQGQCDVTVFPKTWEETKDFWQQDKIVVVRGKAEKRGEKISVLCESVQNYVERAIAAGDEDRSAPLRSQPVFANGNAVRQPVASFKASRSYDEDNGSGEDNPFGLEDQDSPFVLEEPEWLTGAPGVGRVEGGEWRVKSGEGRAQSGEKSEERAGGNIPLSTLHPPPSTLHPPRELRVTIQRTADAEKDKKLLSWVYDLLRGRPGPDRFCIIVRKNGSAMQLDFPNDTTEFTPALEQQLTRRLGAGSVEVREKLLQHGGVSN